MSRWNCPGSEMSRLFLDPVPKNVSYYVFGAELQCLVRIRNVLVLKCLVAEVSRNASVAKPASY